jgi:hypothetical protein
MNTQTPHIIPSLVAAVLALLIQSVAPAAELIAPQGDEIRTSIEHLPKSGTRVGTVSGMIDAPADQVWAVVSQYNQYKEFMPRFKESLILGHDVPATLMDAASFRRHEPDLRDISLQILPGDTFLFYNHLALPVPLGDKRYVLKMMRDPATFSEHWTQVAGDMKVNEGSWILQPMGERTLAVYTTYSDPGIPLPGFLLNVAMKSTLPDIIKAVRRRVQEQNP